MKTCTKCGAVYEGPRCKPCDRVKSALWRQRNPEKFKALKDRDRIKRREAKRVYQEKYRKENYEKVRAAIWDWQKRNREKRRIYGQNRRGRIAAGGVLSKDIVSKLHRLQKGRCACCGKSLGADFQLDHRVALANGGAHEDANMQLLRRSCNASKQARDPVQFMQQRGFLL